MKISSSSCNEALDLGCFDPVEALTLKIITVIVVFVTGSLGVAIPLLSRGLKFLSLDGSFFAITKAFAAGVILSTGFVHILPDAQEALTNRCLPLWPWSKFPFAGFVAMVAALITLLIEALGMEYYEGQHSHSHGPIEDYKDVSIAQGSEYEPLLEESSSSLVPARLVQGPSSSYHSGTRAQKGTQADEEACHPSHHVDVAAHEAEAEKLSVHIRNIVVSQVLEMAVIAHSFIIGLSLGVSGNPCTIKPLLAALSFHQFFEGFALGGCISQAGFNAVSASMRAVVFAVTTPFGIIVGIIVSSSYPANTPIALIVEGLFDAASAGILIYMALVDLIAADFRGARMRTDNNLRYTAFLALFCGSMSMSALAFWL